MPCQSDESHIEESGYGEATDNIAASVARDARKEAVEISSVAIPASNWSELPSLRPMINKVDVSNAHFIIPAPSHRQTT